MSTLQMAGLVVAVVAIVAVLLWLWSRSRSTKQASELARQLFPAWAAQGPFYSGNESAAAMHYAYLAVFGQDEAENMKTSGKLAQHAAVYDSDPGGWEQTRQEALLSASTDAEPYIEIAKNLASIPNNDASDSSHSNTGQESMEGRLLWSSTPGAYEAHLIRRNNNPYFPESRRQVSREDVAEAKRKDEKDFALCQQIMERLSGEIEETQSMTTSGDLLALRERIEDLIFFSLGVGGPATQLATQADRLRNAVVEDLRSAFSNDKQNLDSIEKADTFHNDNVRRFHIPLSAQMLREDSPIPKDETISAILSEDPSTIAIIINSLPEERRPLIEMGGLKILKQALNEGYVEPQTEDKISALGGEWPIKHG